MAKSVEKKESKQQKKEVKTKDYIVLKNISIGVDADGKVSNDLKKGDTISLSDDIAKNWLKNKIIKQKI